MTDEPKPKKAWWRRKRAWAGAALLALSYPLSFVPACWVLMRVAPLDKPPFSRSRSYDVLRATYRPVGAGLKACPEPVRDAVRRVVDWGAPEGRSLDVRGRIGISYPATMEADGHDGLITLLVW